MGNLHTIHSVRASCCYDNNHVVGIFLMALVSPKKVCPLEAHILCIAWKQNEVLNDYGEDNPTKDQPFTSLWIDICEPEDSSDEHNDNP